MIFNSLTITVLFIAKVALSLGQPETPPNKVTGQDMRLKRQESLKYPKQMIKMKGRGSNIKSRLTDSNESDLAKSMRFSGEAYKQYKPLGRSSEDHLESNVEAADKGKTKRPWGDIVQELNSLTKNLDKLDQAGKLKPPIQFNNPQALGVDMTTWHPAHFIEPTPTMGLPQPELRLAISNGGNSDGNFRGNRPRCNCVGACTCGAPKPDCPASIETMFVCQQCRTHYIIRINVRESKCSHCSESAPNNNDGVGFVGSHENLHYIHLKGRGRKFKGKFNDDDESESPPKSLIYSPVGNRLRYYKSRKKTQTTLSPEESADSLVNKHNWNDFIQEIGGATETADKEQGMEPKETEQKVNGEVVEPPVVNAVAITIGPGRRLGESVESKLTKPMAPWRNSRPLGDSDCCPSSVETMFVCPKCRTHYAFRINVRESECAHQTPKPCGSGGSNNDNNNKISQKLRRESFKAPDPGSPDVCPSSVETMYVCAHCRTHYILRINIRESKCAHSPPATTSSCMKDEPLLHSSDQLETRMRKKLTFPNQKQFWKMSHSHPIEK